ncbi:Gfo/Idh/MocA family oxidoreductase [Mucilaginibacter sp. BJC16-A38]|uniref:Gfo/Idh/MocA family protein n=1 Tax=Mucilaginibacter phenanthrenivorans TaxID=1234842 RepID=UPI002157BF23|nr:Gfo/Idh/MocA family oxidoreductase [Mucilaginibacter phenanthrenivorans]MCR8561435.1 Gfo/Idh/MocA family oxidoreductase [Mucilaginibacter phenanthrenivorans]
MSKINWGIIGCGDVTEKKSGPAFSKVAGSSLIAVMRRDAEKAADYARRHNVGSWYDNADELMADERINAVYIATPPSSHMDYAITALGKGFNVYVEKPVTRNASEARQIAEAVKQHPNQKLTVAHYRRAVPMFLHVKQFLDTKLIGDVRTVQIRMWQSRKPKLIADVETNWRLQPEVSGGGYFHDLAPHQLDLMLFYFGEPEKYSGFSLNQSGATTADDNVNGQILFKNQVVVNGSWCFNVAENQTTDTCEIIGTKGRITFPFFGNYISWKTDEDEQTLMFTHPEHIQQPMIEKIVAYFNDEGPNPCSIEEAITLMDIMDAFTGK